MADRYSKFIVNGNGKNPGFRPIFEGLGFTNIHDLKKQDFIDIATEFDSVNAPLTLDDPDIKTKASQAQKEALRAAVDARRRTRQGEAKAKGGKRMTSGKKKATGQRAKAQAQKTGTTSAQPKKDKTNAKKDEASPSDDEIAEQDDERDVQMAEDQDGGDAKTVVDPTADAVSGLHSKRKRRPTGAPVANKRIRSTRSKLAGQENHSQEPEEDKKAAAVSTRTTRATKQARGQTNTHVIQETLPLDDPSSNHSRPSRKHSMASHKNDLEDASARPQNMLSAGSVESNSKTPLQRESLQKDKEDPSRPAGSEDSAGDEASNESEESTGSEVASDNALSVEDIKESDVKNMLSMKNYFCKNPKCLYDEEEAHNRVCAKTGNMGSSRDPNWNPKFEGTHKVDGFMRIHPLCVAKTYDRSLMDPREREVHDAQKEEWERQDAKNAGLPPPTKPVKPTKKNKRTWHDAVKERRWLL
ncbi:hypothetical protein AA0120_g12184 [Alternaria tenuissima]|jgi:hypothetical protein|nr:hypothetical protein AALT_g2761 [Alternaria alternata]RYN75025.1 hypothetical protein AA0120_g12184 [Alternaria tenuissima]